MRLARIAPVLAAAAGVAALAFAGLRCSGGDGGAASGSGGDAGDDALAQPGADATASSDGANDVIAPGDASDAPSAPLETVHFIGRFDTSAAAGPKFEWSASAMRTRLSGTGISVKLADPGNQYQVVIDGTP